MLHLPSGTRIDGDEELVYRAVDLDQAGGDGLYAADIAEATGLPQDQVLEVVSALLAKDVLEGRAPDDQLGPRYVTGRAG